MSEDAPKQRKKEKRNLLWLTQKVIEKAKKDLLFVLISVKL